MAEKCIVMSIKQHETVGTTLVHVDHKDEINGLSYSHIHRNIVIEDVYEHCSIVDHTDEDAKWIRTIIPMKGKLLIPVMLLDVMAKFQTPSVPIYTPPDTQRQIRSYATYERHAEDPLWTTKISMEIKPRDHIQVYTISIHGTEACPFIDMKYKYNQNINSQFRLPSTILSTKDEKERFKSDHMGAKLYQLDSRVLVMISCNGMKGWKPVVSLAVAYTMAVSYKVGYPHISSTAAMVLMAASENGWLAEVNWPTISPTILQCKLEDWYTPPF